MEKTIGFIGAGRICSIMLQAFNNQTVTLDKVTVFDVNMETTKRLKQKFPDIKVGDLNIAAQNDLVFIALHPPVIIETLDKIRNFVANDSIVISLAPKITIDKISKTLSNTNVVRLIPNATSIINKGYNPVCFSDDCCEKAEILNFLSLLGQTFETDEAKLEAYAISSAMLPTYFWFQWYEMLQISERMGLTASESNQSVRDSLLAAIELMFDGGFTREEVFDLIPVKPIGEHEAEIQAILQSKLLGLYDKIKA